MTLLGGIITGSIGFLVALGIVIGGLAVWFAVRLFSTRGRG